MILIMDQNTPCILALNIEAPKLLNLSFIKVKNLHFPGLSFTHSLPVADHALLLENLNIGQSSPRFSRTA